MNKGYLMFSQDQGHTMLKDEPEDLTHLAPTAGDACIPLEDSPFDMFDDFILPDNYCSLLGDDLVDGSPVDALTPDSLLLSSPEPQLFQENDSSLTDLSLDAFDVNRSDDIEEGNSPFIPINDELAVLEPAVMWGALPDSVRQARPQPTETQTTSAPALQRLLTASSTGPPPQDLITNIYSDSGLIPSRTVSTWDTGVKRVMKQEQEEPSAKRAKRSPSPVQAPSATKPSSSVLMNLLDIQQKAQHQLQPQQLHPNFQMVRNQPPIVQNTTSHIPLPVINVLQGIPNTQIMRTNSPINPQILRTAMTSSPMSPLSLNVSPMYSLPSSPASYNSPAISPAQRERVLTPYSTPQSLSPAAQFQQFSPESRMMSPVGVLRCDPYLGNKMQPSPGFLQTPDIAMLDAATDFWTDTDMMQGTSDLLAALDDVKLD